MGEPRAGRTWLIRKMVERPVDMPIASIIGPYCSDPVSVVEESQLRQAEAERDNGWQLARERGERLENAKANFRAAEARAEKAEAELREAREALAPFAELAHEVDALRHEDDSTCPHRLRAGDVRRARDAAASLSSRRAID